MSRDLRGRLRAPWSWLCLCSVAFASSSSLADGRVKAPPSLVEIIEASSIDSLSVSPDGGKIAFRVISPSVAANRTEVRWFEADIAGMRPPMPLGRPSDAQWMPLYDLVSYVRPQWAPGARALYVTQLNGSQVQVHRLTPQGGDVAITSDPADVVDFSLTVGGRRLTYRVRNTRAAIAAAQAHEEVAGVHIDRTVLTEGSRLTRNFQIGSRRTTIRRTDAAEAGELGAGSLREKSIALAGIASARGRTAADRIWKTAATIATATPENAMRKLRLGDQITVSALQIAPPDALLGYARYQLVADLPGGSRRRCSADICSGLSPALREIAINDETGEVVILYERDFSARSELHGWNPRTGATRLIYAAAGALDGGNGHGISAGDGPGTSICPRAGQYLLCVEAGPSRPPRLIRIDLSTGRSTTLYDPNALLASRQFGRVRYLEWRDPTGRPSNGVLVTPAGTTGQLPLVITTYRCRGFLRGGVGSLVPEHLLTQMGFAALCVNNNNAARLDRNADGSTVPLALHQAALASYRAVIDRLASEGVIDRSRVGIAGHSFSSMVTAYAISHTDLFAAACLGTWFTIDPAATFLTAPTADSWRRDAFTAVGLSPEVEDRDGLWKQVSPSAHAAAISAPLLLQLPESDGWSPALQIYAAMQAAGRPVDMYVYPQSGHSAARSPAQLLWRNRRSLAWFAFWLQGREDPALAEDKDYKDWRALRRASSIQK